MSFLYRIFSPRQLLNGFGGCPASREMSLSEVQRLEATQELRVTQLLADSQEYPELLALTDDYPFLERLAYDLHALMNSSPLHEHEAVLRLRNTITAMAEEKVLAEWDEAFFSAP